MKVEIEVEGGGEQEEKEYGDYDKYEIEAAMRTLLEAEEIKKDKEKMKYVAQCMKDKADKIGKVINSIDDLKKLAKEKMAED